MSVRVAVIGNHAHPFCSEVHWARAFEENGCEVTPIQVDDAVAHPELAMEILRSRDLVTYTRTHAPGRYLDRSWTDRWRALEADGIITIGLHLDRFWDLERAGLIASGDPQFTVGTLFSADGGNDGRFAAAGVNHRWFRPGVDRQEALVDAPHIPELADKIVFTGSGGNYHGEYRERADLLCFLRDRYGTRFVHYGHGGDRPVVRQTALNSVLQSAAAVIGDSCFANSADYATKSHRYVSDRLYETIGRGAFLIFPRLPSMVEDFDLLPGAHFVAHVPGDWDDLALRIDAALTFPKVRAVTASGGRDYTLLTHTYTRRMADLLAEVGLGAEESVV